MLLGLRARCVLVLLFVFAVASAAQGATVTIAWDASPDAAVTAYTVMVGEKPGEYSRTIDAGGTTTFAVDKLVEGRTYYFIVKGRTIEGDETDPTNEVTLTVPLSALPTFDGTGSFDMLLQDRVEGWIGAWTMNGTSLADGGLLEPSRVPDVQWRIVGHGDFNGDNQRDIVWQHGRSGGLAVWIMQGRTATDIKWITPAAVPDVRWKIVAVHDMNGDRKPDLVWQHADGSIATWMMDGVVRLDVVWVTPQRVPDTNWKIVAAGDLDGDGKGDLLWQHTATGGLAAWLMEGVVRRDVLWLEPDRLPAGWKVAALADADADGSTDLVLVDTAGVLAVWLMDGLRLRSGEMLSPDRLPGQNWSIAGSR